MYATILFSLFACTQMENPGEPFSPVNIADPAPGDATIQEDNQLLNEEEEEVNPLFEPVGSVLVVSEVDEQEKQPSAEDNILEEVPMNNESSENEKEVSNLEEEKEKIDVVEKEIEVQKEVTETSSASIGEWPLRVVKTEAGLQPPRAILGLPSGEEIVIRPGMQLPEENLIIMSIGSKAVVLARIHTEGDHARVEHLTLPSLND